MEHLVNNIKRLEYLNSWIPTLEGNLQTFKISKNKIKKLFKEYNKNDIQMVKLDNLVEECIQQYEQNIKRIKKEIKELEDTLKK